MIYIILLFSSINIFKSILISEFYSNYLMLMLFPLELSTLSFSNSYEDIIIKWIINGWFKQNEDINYINNIQSYDDYVILVSWGITFVLYNIYILLKYRKSITKYIYLSYILKFLIVNYLSLFLWSINLIINYEQIEYFSVLIIIVFLFNFISFWFPGILFNFVYGEKMYIHRKKYNFLIKNYNLKYKYFTLTLNFFKSLTFIFMLFYNFYIDAANYILITFNIFMILIYFYIKNIFNINVINKYLIILHSFS